MQRPCFKRDSIGFNLPRKDTEVKWFKHYTVASSDAGLNKVIDEHGLIALSYFWLIAEQCAAKYEGDGNFTFQFSMSQVRRLWRIRSVKVELLLHSYTTNNFFSSTIVEDLITIHWPKLSKYVHKDAISSKSRPATGPPVAGQKKEKKEKYIRKTPSASVCDLSEMWNNRCGALAKVVKITTQRSKKAKALEKELSPEQLDKIFENISGSDFLLGKTEGGWKCTFDWLIKPGNAIKVLEGQYNNNGTTESETTVTPQNIWDEKGI